MQTSAIENIGERPNNNKEVVAWSFINLMANNLYKFIPRFAFVIPVAYFAGFLIVTSHFYKFGFMEFDVLRADYFLAGGMYLLVTSLLAVPMLFLTILTYTGNPTPVAKWERQVILAIAFEVFVFLMVSIVIYTITIFLGSMLDRAIGIGIFEGRGLLISKPFIEYYLSLYIYICFMPFALKIIGKNYVIIVGCAIVASIISSVFLYTKSIYPLIPPNIGGGQYIKGIVVLDAETRGQMAKVGVEVGNRPVIILRHTANSVYVALNSGDRAIELKRENVIAIRYQ